MPRVMLVAISMLYRPVHAGPWHCPGEEPHEHLPEGRHGLTKDGHHAPRAPQHLGSSSLPGRGVLVEPQLRPPSLVVLALRQATVPLAISGILCVGDVIMASRWSRDDVPAHAAPDATDAEHQDDRSVRHLFKEAAARALRAPPSPSLAARPSPSAGAEPVADQMVGPTAPKRALQQVRAGHPLAQDVSPRVHHRRAPDQTFKVSAPAATRAPCTSHLASSPGRRVPFHSTGQRAAPTGLRLTSQSPLVPSAPPAPAASLAEYLNRRLLAAEGRHSPRSGMSSPASVSRMSSRSPSRSRSRSASRSASPVVRSYVGVQTKESQLRGDDAAASTGGAGPSDQSPRAGPSDQSTHQVQQPPRGHGLRGARILCRPSNVVGVLLAQCVDFDPIGQTYSLLDDFGRRHSVRLHGPSSLRFEVIEPAPCFGVRRITCGICQDEEDVTWQTECCRQSLCGECFSSIQHQRTVFNTSIAVKVPPSGQACPFCNGGRYVAEDPRPHARRRQPKRTSDMAYGEFEWDTVALALCGKRAIVDRFT